MLETLRQRFEPNSDQTMVTEPIMSPGHEILSVESREDSYTDTGQTVRLAWGARTDVGLVREHNEDSYLVRAPVFAVCDGMGGHAAGEVASSIAVNTIAENAPLHADDVLLGAAVEAANLAIINGAINGEGKQGMGCTATSALIEDDRMAIAHVGDSRIYLLHAGTLVRLTHDHSYVEELVEAGEITADEARVHPSRSVITRALGSDPDMYADHFTIGVSTDDRIILCSDGLSSMVEDSEIEAIAVSSATPQAAADNLVAAALTQGGHDNITVVVIDILDDGSVEQHHKRNRRAFLIGALVTLIALAVLMTAGALFVRHSWFVGANGRTVGIYQGIHADILGHPLYSLVETTSVELKDLPETVVKALNEGVPVSSEAEAAATVESYRDQIDAAKTAAAVAAEKATGDTEPSEATRVTHEQTPEASAQAETAPKDTAGGGGE
ncbi:MAG: Stp1/IreP family PP2C-type Ser/Thr phosphatase [Coriobacteriales bacterium]|nr:Stp1/IreP family PP2C-type Ser/Thr phosphatase [Coriobacteriales bacterium]